MSSVERHVAKGTSGEFAFRGLINRGESDRPCSVGHGEFNIVMMLTDVVTILLANALSRTIVQFQFSGVAVLSLDDVGPAVVVAGLFVLWMKSRGMYRPVGCPSLRRQLVNVSSVWFGLLVLLAAAVFAMNLADTFNWRSFLLFSAIGLLGLVLQRILWMRVGQGLIGAKPGSRNVILLTEKPQTGYALETLERLGLSLQYHFALPIEARDVGNCEETIDQIIACARESDIEEILVAADPRYWNDLQEAIKALRVLPFRIYLLPTGPSAEVYNGRLHQLGDNVCLELQRPPLSSLECAVKRGMDILLGGIALIALSPVMLAVMIGIKLDSPGPILFRQTRRGFNGKIFKIFKFRTMSVMEDGLSVRQASKADPRVTRLGKWLRRASIDELPQLLNVMLGDMSLVGPRPHAMAHDVEFNRVVANYAFRQRMKPGLTGWAQVHGFRGPTPNVESIRKRIEHDIWYIDHWSIWIDLLIVLRTAAEVAKGRNAY